MRCNFVLEETRTPKKKYSGVIHKFKIVLEVSIIKTGTSKVLNMWNKYRALGTIDIICLKTFKLFMT